MSTSKKGLINFTNKINRLINNENNVKNQIANQIGEYGLDIAKSLIVYESFEITKTQARNGEVQIIASDHSERPHIAYVEFGTGYEGKYSTYEGTLPTFWEYYMPSEHKVYELGKWKAGRGAIVKGQVSQGNMWNVSMTLQQDLHDIKFYIKY